MSHIINNNKYNKNHNMTNDENDNKKLNINST